MWIQNYDPLENWPLSTLLAAVPVLVLLGLLASGRASAWGAALVGLGAAMGAAVGVFGMPIGLAVAAAGHGVVFAAFRIVWLIVAAVFLYDIAVATGQFDVMKASIARLSGDRRIQAVLVAFSFGAFSGGDGGVRGSGGDLGGLSWWDLGFKPFQAALLCLIANTAPVAWGAIGTPLQTLAGVTGLDVEALSMTSGRILPPLSLILPFWLVRSMVPWRATFAVWPALLAIGGTFAVDAVRLVELRRLPPGRPRLVDRQPARGRPRSSRSGNPGKNGGSSTTEKENRFEGSRRDSPLGPSLKAGTVRSSLDAVHLAHLDRLDLGSAAGQEARMDAATSKKWANPPA